MPTQPPQPLPQSSPQRDPERRKPSRFPGLVATALLIGLGGWAMGHFSGGAAASAADNLSEQELAQRAQIFHAQPSFAVKHIAREDTERVIAALPLPDEGKAALSQTLAQNGQQRLVELILWDDVDVDGDVVRVDSLGYSQTVTLTKTAATLHFPVEDGVPVTVTGIRDGGGGITLGFTGSGQGVSLPVLAEGQIISLYLR